MANLRLSKLAENLSSFSVSKLSEKIEGLRQAGEKVYNFTQGDFAPSHFPIPSKLESEIIAAYRDRHTSYPYVGGIRELRSAISNHIRVRGQFEYDPDEIIVTCGGRPLIYLLFKTLLDPGEKIIYTAPSWNNQYFIYLADAVPILVEAKSKNNFMVTPDELRPHLKEANLLTINSPSNPSGTVFDDTVIREILELVIVENRDRIRMKQKPLYIFFDIMYWLLTYNNISCTNPLLQIPEIRDYVVFIDGISKCFAATGVRVGWAFGPKPIIDKMRSILSHTGAWAPKPEQVGTAKFLQDFTEVSRFLDLFKAAMLSRLNVFYETAQKLKHDGYNVDAIAPQGAIYLSLMLDLVGAKTASNTIIQSVDDVAEYILKTAKMAIVAFHYFGMNKNLPWFRLSVGTCSFDEAKQAASMLDRAVRSLA